MSETLKMWMTPEGFMVIFAMVLILGGLIVKALRAVGKDTAADTVQSLLTRAETAEKVLGSVMTGVQKFKLTATPAEAKALIDTMKKTNMDQGVEELVAPIVADLNKGTAPTATDAVRSVTTRIPRKVS